MAGKKRHSNKRHRSEKGAVLIMVLFIIAGLAVVSVDMNRNVLLDYAFARTTEAGAASKLLLKNAETLAAFFLVRDFQKEKTEPGNESLDSVRGRFREWLEAYNDILEKWDMEIDLDDENSRFPLKVLFSTSRADKTRAETYAIMFERMLAGLLAAHGFDGGEDAARICARRYLEQLLAWGGQKMLTEEAVKWYVSQDPAYYPPGRAPESYAELAMVYWPDVDAALARNTILGTADLPGLADSCSLWATGPINVNTMKTAVGWGFCDTLNQGQAFMRDFEKARAGRGDWLPSGWQNEIFAAHGIVSPPARIISDRSRWYRIRSRLKMGLAQTSGEAVGWINKTQMTWAARALM